MAATAKDIAEIRKRYKAERNNITHIYGVYINAEHETIASFDAPLADMALDEADKYLKLFQKTLSGKIGNQVLPLEFSTQHVRNDANYALLKELRDGGMDDEDARQRLVDKISEAVPYEEESYLILMASEDYDVPADDDEGGGSDEVFRYIICSVCQVKNSKSELGYDASRKMFRDLGSKQIAAKPVFGFMFPSFSERSADIYGAVTYNNCPEYGDLVMSVFGCSSPATADLQREVFSEALSTAMGKPASVEDLLDINRQFIYHAEEQRLAGEKEIPAVNAEEIARIVSGSPTVEIDEQAFCDVYEERIGSDSETSIENISTQGPMTITLNGFKITADAEHIGNIKCETIRGKQCIIIETDGEAEINGMTATVV